MEVDDILVGGGVGDVENIIRENNVETAMCGEDGVEADGGYSSNSCNGGEDVPDGSQDDYDPFEEDGLEQANHLLHTEGEAEGNIFDEPVVQLDEPRICSIDTLEREDNIDAIGHKVLQRTDDAFSVEAESLLENPLLEEVNRTLCDSNADGEHC